ncbi:MAG: hypothetical protein AABX33_06880 [Nanoarchaeota archaeon]
MREEFNKDFVTFVPKPSWRGIEKNLKFMTTKNQNLYKLQVYNYKLQVYKVI